VTRGAISTNSAPARSTISFAVDFCGMQLFGRLRGAVMVSTLFSANEETLHSPAENAVIRAFRKKTCELRGWGDSFGISKGRA
jgi:hypothetical protein